MGSFINHRVFLFFFFLTSFTHDCDSAASVQLMQETPCLEGQSCQLKCVVLQGSKTTGLVFIRNTLDMAFCRSPDNCDSAFPDIFAYNGLNSTVAYGKILKFNPTTDVGNWSCVDSPGNPSIIQVRNFIRPGEAVFSNPCPIHLPAQLTASSSNLGTPPARIVIMAQGVNTTSAKGSQNVTVTVNREGDAMCFFQWEEFPNYTIDENPKTCYVQDGTIVKNAIAFVVVLALLSICSSIFDIIVIIFRAHIREKKKTNLICIAVAIALILVLTFAIAVLVYNLVTHIQTIRPSKDLFQASAVFTAFGFASCIFGIITIVLVSKG